MKDPIGSLACGFDRFAVGNIGGGDLEPPFFAVPLQIGLTAPGKVIDDPHPTTFGNQPINEMTADKAGPTRNHI